MGGVENGTREIEQAGVFWLYLGKGDGTFAACTEVGAGWNKSKDVIGIGDGNSDAASTCPC
ncbi:hypothetical protein ABZ454_35410 [Streptomyces sp. NPDC005803]|uniref:hypothetical protein n=1 Tax=Streptomyces sp. NPDC005803 TaxID=3154297 RepID=UPI0033F158A2